MMYQSIQYLGLSWGEVAMWARSLQSSGVSTTTKLKFVLFFCRLFFSYPFSLTKTLECLFTEKENR